MANPTLVRICFQSTFSMQFDWFYYAFFVQSTFFISFLFLLFFLMLTKRSCNDKSYFSSSVFFLSLFCEWIYRNAVSHNISLFEKKYPAVGYREQKKPYSGWIQYIFFFRFVNFIMFFAPNVYCFSEKKWINFPDKKWDIWSSIWRDAFFSTRQKRTSSAGDEELRVLFVSM